MMIASMPVTGQRSSKPRNSTYLKALGVDLTTARRAYDARSEHKVSRAVKVIEPAAYYQLGVPDRHMT